MQSAVQFPTKTRIHVALNASDIEASIAFYSTLFGEGPTKTRPGYAKFEPADPPVNLTLNHATPAAGPTPRASASHFGVQVKSAEAVADAVERFRQAGLQTETEDAVECCYAVQDKVWVSDPDGARWEVFVVLDNDAPSYGACCETQAALVSLGGGNSA